MSAATKRIESPGVSAPTLKKKLSWLSVHQRLVFVAAVDLTSNESGRATDSITLLDLYDRYERLARQKEYGGFGALDKCDVVDMVRQLANNRLLTVEGDAKSDQTLRLNVPLDEAKRALKMTLNGASKDGDEKESDGEREHRAKRRSDGGSSQTPNLNKLRSSTSNDKTPEPRSKVLNDDEVICLSDDNDDKQCVVESVLAKRSTQNGKIEYLLKWQGYPVEKATWKPEASLNIPELIAEYERKQRSKEARKSGGGGDLSQMSNPMRSKSRKPEKPDTSGKATSSHKNEEKPDTDDKVALLHKTKEKRKKERSKEDEHTSSARDDNDNDDRGATSSKRSAPHIVKILGVTNVHQSAVGEHSFLCVFSDNTGDLVKACDANVQCPQTVIKFYESRLHVKKR